MPWERSLRLDRVGFRSIIQAQLHAERARFARRAGKRRRQFEREIACIGEVVAIGIERKMFAFEADARIEHRIPVFPKQVGIVLIEIGPAGPYAFGADEIAVRMPVFGGQHQIELRCERRPVVA